MLFAAACLRFAWTTSPTFDEPGLIYSGYASLSADATKTSTANLILAQSWVALPLLVLKPALPTDTEIQAVEPVNREYGRLFLFHPKNDWRTILRAARVMNILLGVALGGVIYCWARHLFGVGGAMVSLGLYCLSPTMLANSSVATTDLATALGFTVAANRWWALMHRVTPANVITCGVATGLLGVTKFSSLLLGPMVLGMVIMRLAVRRPLYRNGAPGPAGDDSGRRRQVAWLLVGGAAAVAVGVMTVWLAYAPQTQFWTPAVSPPFQWEAVAPAGPLARLADWLHRWHLLPDPYLWDLWLFEATTSARRAYLLGEYSLKGWWSFFPVAWWCKTPIPFMIALGLAALAVRRYANRHALIPLVVLIAVYGGAALCSSLNLGLRHLLPVFPALFILAGLAAAAPLPGRAWRAALAVLLLWSAAEVWFVRFEFLAYFNQFAGGSANGHRVLVDSSYEWGQDLPAVEDWLAQRGAAGRPVYFSYFGNADLRRFRIDAVLLPQFFDLRPVTAYELRPGTYVISATMLHSLYGPLCGPWRASHEAAYQALLPAIPAAGSGTRDEERTLRLALFDALRFGRLCSYLRKRRPDARITYGMLVFELSAEELDVALRQPSPEGQSTYLVRGTEHLPQSAVEFLK